MPPVRQPSGTHLSPLLCLLSVCALSAGLLLPSSLLLALVIAAVAELLLHLLALHLHLLLVVAGGVALLHGCRVPAQDSGAGQGLSSNETRRKSTEATATPRRQRAAEGTVQSLQAASAACRASGGIVQQQEAAQAAAKRKGSCQRRHQACPRQLGVCDRAKPVVPPAGNRLRTSEAAELACLSGERGWVVQTPLLQPSRHSSSKIRRASRRSEGYMLRRGAATAALDGIGAGASECGRIATQRSRAGSAS